MRPIERTALLLAACALAACASEPEPAVDRDTLAQRQRDSLLGASSVPGAAGVRGALDGADSAAARAARIQAESHP